MDTKKVFRKISSKLLDDFEISGEINHNVSKGTHRENALKEFLQKGRLPMKYGIGSGEIIGRATNVSKQSDLIIYDQLNGFSLIYDEQTQVYPIECVAGVVEVKSTLTKTELLKSLENIKSVKSLAPNETTSMSIAGMVKMGYKRPTPFGAVFAYSLGKNSLDSLVKNLSKWEQGNPRELWPNVIAVLNEGLIFHYGDGLRAVFSNEEILKSQFPSSIQYKNDTLFKFYAALLDLCAGTNLGPVELERYFDGSEQIGEHIVSNHDQMTRNDGSEQVYKMNEKFIKKIVKHCSSKGAIKHRDFFIKRFGVVPDGMTEEYLNSDVYFYNPKKLKGIHEVGNPIIEKDGVILAAEGLIEPCHYIIVDDETFYIPLVYITEKDLEVIPNKTRQDL